MSQGICFRPLDSAGQIAVSPQVALQGGVVVIAACFISKDIDHD